MKIVTIVGARPQFIKAAAVSRELKKHPAIEEVLVHTGQHYDQNMSQVFFDQMEIPKPSHHLEVNSMSHGAMTGAMLEKIENVLIAEKPDGVLVFGDTNSTLAGALAATKLHIPLIHVEAGLRSFNNRMPEEINRILTDRVSSFLFCPTETAIKNLSDEGFANFQSRVIKCGDVMLDAALYYGEKSSQNSSIIKDQNLEKGRFALATIHRAENTDDPKILGNLISALNSINQSAPVIVPLHPRTQKLLEGIDTKPQFKIIPPVGYFDMIELIKGCHCVLTDSGGLQKEAFFFSKGCLTLREQTEWVELVEVGANLIVGTDPEKITDGYKKMKDCQNDFDHSLYGGGQASKNIVDCLLKELKA
ncbi:MAG: UDP-N-acetylglucosamine 2-epimerase (non-hydrolyzing) [Halobacteriovoraceae bacterium]|jgi:UDP-GlcNAc3NAcA epimerase|nr:UDP-N-acetylglucosamine 2-epimerase (non-hydrolyzing) [Halobacteriovoraceae bacterium]MBT5096031.1 UDP-N-acetylglucosamine 2-epimerase (non-hydrolyzing) [Halobacteriovoraceae bacterium]